MGRSREVLHLSVKMHLPLNLFIHLSKSNNLVSSASGFRRWRSRLDCPAERGRLNPVSLVALIGVEWLGFGDDPSGTALFTAPDASSPASRQRPSFEGNGTSYRGVLELRGWIKTFFPSTTSNFSFPNRSRDWGGG